MLKRVLKESFPWIARFLSQFPLKYIVFESIPDFTDNSKAVFEEMVRRGLNKQYCFVWLTYKKDSKLEIENTKCVHNRLLQIYYSMRSRYLLSSNTFATKYGPYQTALFLGHGLPLKSLMGYEAPPGLDYSIGLGKETNFVQAREANIPEENVLSLGYPRNDSLNKKSGKDLRNILGDFAKILVWYPTYRQHNLSTIQSAAVNSLPILHNESDAELLNELARELNYLIVLKPHFSQDISYVKKLGLSNILFINDEFFVEHNISSYEFVGACDALITDYSSIYFDYLLCDKPIIAVWEDKEEYIKNRGFVIDLDYYFSGAYKVYSVEDFIQSLRILNIEGDLCQTERRNILKKVHDNIDFESTKRVVDFIEKEL